MTTRFVDIDLSRLKTPDALKVLDYEKILSTRMTALQTRLEAAGYQYDVGKMLSDPNKILQEHSSIFEVTLVGTVNDAVRATLLATATGADLEHKAAEFGVVRQVLQVADPAANPPIEEILETDDSLRRRRQLAVEALSTAGPEGAYVFHGFASHPHVSDVAVFDPHSGLCGDGEVLVVFASVFDDGIPTDLLLDSAADLLDARTLNYAVTAPRTRTIDRRQKLRPLTDKVIVEACTGVDYQVSAVLKVPYGPDAEVIRSEAEKRLLDYTGSRRMIGFEVSDSAIAAAVHVPDENGVALVTDADITITVNGSPVAGFTPGPKELPRATSVDVTVQQAA